MKKPKVLAYVSSATRVPHVEGGSHETGVYLGELVEPLMPLHEAGYEIDFISPDGNTATIDPSSLSLSLWGLSKKKRQKALDFLDTLNSLGLAKPMKLSDLLKDQQKLETYNVLFIPGGHAPMTDILHKNWLESDELNAETGELLQHFHDNNKITSMICHGPAALGAAPVIDGKWIYDGYKMTCVPMFAEWLTEDKPLMKNTGGHMPDYPKKLLKRNGGDMKNTLMGRSLVIEDRELLTGQDPFAAKELGKKLKAKIERAMV
ncbi:MAG: type 1 glutamine amidotransferase domain-containing protein [Acidiferrobacterales bacterium]